MDGMILVILADAPVPARRGLILGQWLEGIVKCLTVFQFE